MKISAQLTKRENQIAELIAWGATKKDVANKLFISERTAENHTRNIYEKTGVTKANELSAWWFCTRFNISFDLSPLKRQLISASLILITIYSLAFNPAMRRPKRIRTNDIEIINE